MSTNCQDVRALSPCLNKKEEPNIDKQFAKEIMENCGANIKYHRFPFKNWSTNW